MESRDNVNNNVLLLGQCHENAVRMMMTCDDCDRRDVSDKRCLVPGPWGRADVTRFLRDCFSSSSKKTEDLLFDIHLFLETQSRSCHVFAVDGPT